MGMKWFRFCNTPKEPHRTGPYAPHHFVLQHIGIPWGLN
jgi:hypothetical protein